MHWCAQESEALLLLLSIVPFIGIYIKKLHANWHAKHQTECNHENHIQ